MSPAPFRPTEPRAHYLDPEDYELVPLDGWLAWAVVALVVMFVGPWVVGVVGLVRWAL